MFWLETDVFSFHCSDPIAGNIVYIVICLLDCCEILTSIYDSIIQIQICQVAASLLDFVGNNESS